VSTGSTGARLHTTSAPRRPSSAVLVFHGGAADSTMRVAPLSPAVLRLIPVARAVAAQVPDAAVYRLRFSVRGWNGDGADVLADAHWAIDQIAARHPGLPIVVVGHSLGGRVAMHVAGSCSSVDIEGERSRVIGAVGLTPWVDPSDPVDLLAGVPLAVIQGTRDRIVPEQSTRPWLARAARAGARIDSTIIQGGGHAMLRHYRRWHRLTAEGVRSVLAQAPRSARAAAES
jgi:alpha-beta hydrolase superfamily lysophospholipase